MTNLLHDAAASEWVKQFDEHDQSRVVEMLKIFRLVSRDEFVLGIRNALRVFAEKHPELLPMGLYAERDVRTRLGVPNRLFKETTTRPIRAYGRGPSPIMPKRADAPEVGSEGIVANIIADLSRANRSAFVSHPGPEVIRKRKIRSFVIVTDLIGSGRRACLYLESAWRVASLRSWHSFKLLRFVVVSYAATPNGSGLVKSHRSAPILETVTACPVISDLPSKMAESCREVCNRYDPKRKPRRYPWDSLGYKGGGALIAFAHGCPNNVPNIFHCSGGVRRWRALFPDRTNPLDLRASDDSWSPEKVADQLELLGLKYEHAIELVRRTQVNGHLLLLFLQATRRGPREDDALARRTGLTVLQIRDLREQARRNLWISVQGRLTDAGAGQMRVRRIPKSHVEPVPPRKEIDYYPTALRAPFKV